MTVTAILEITVRAESLGDAARIIDEVLATTRSFEGNLGCDVVVDVADPAHYAVIERWESLAHDEAYRAFRATPDGASVLPTIAEDIRLTRYTEA